MAETNRDPLRVDFKRHSDAGLIAYGELDHALGLTGLAGSMLTEARHRKTMRHLVEGLIRRSLGWRARRT